MYMGSASVCDLTVQAPSPGPALLTYANSFGRSEFMPSVLKYVIKYFTGICLVHLAVPNLQHILWASCRTFEKCNVDVVGVRPAVKESNHVALNFETW